MLRLAFDRLINSIQKIGILWVRDMVRKSRGQMGSAPFAVRLERAFPQFRSYHSYRSTSWSNALVAPARQ